MICHLIDFVNSPNRYLSILFLEFHANSISPRFFTIFIFLHILKHLHVDSIFTKIIYQDLLRSGALEIIVCVFGLHVIGILSRGTFRIFSQMLLSNVLTFLSLLLRLVIHHILMDCWAVTPFIIIIHEIIRWTLKTTHYMSQVAHLLAYLSHIGLVTLVRIWFLTLHLRVMLIDYLLRSFISI